MLPLTTENPFQRMPDEALCRIFENLDMHGLVRCSFVDQLFYACSNDTPTWKWVVSKHPKTQHLSNQENLSGLQIKRSVLDLLRHTVTDHHARGEDFLVFKQSQPSLESYQEPPKVTLPLKFNGKHYFIHEGEEEIDLGDGFDGYCDYRIWSDLEIKNAESNETEKRIRLNGMAVTHSPVATDGEIFIYKARQQPTEGIAEKIKFVRLTNTESGERTLTKEPPKSYSIEIKKGVVRLINNREIINFNYFIIPLTITLHILKMKEERRLNNPSVQICVLREFVPLTEKVPREFICPETGQIMREPVQYDCKQLHTIIDKNLQTRILEWLKKEVFENQYDQLPQAEKAIIDSQCSEFQNLPRDPNSKGNEKITTEEAKILALHHHLYFRQHTISLHPPADTRYLNPQLLSAFAKLPLVFQQEIYSHLCVIQGRQVSAELGENAMDKAQRLRRSWKPCGAVCMKRNSML
jgi:hypothetical protein